MTRILLTPGGLRALLARREIMLEADERAAVQAALDQAGPEMRAQLERLLRREPVQRRQPRRRSPA